MKVETYEIIKDPYLLSGFIQWLPDLLPNETYYLCLFARNKYCKELAHIRSDKAQIKRFVSDKVRMFNKIRQLESVVGSYQQFISKTPNMIEVNNIPQEALALYINPNPRNVYKATFESIKDLTTCIQTKNQGYNPVQQVLSQIQKSIGTKKYVIFDIDGESLDFNKLLSIVPREALKVLKTRGGFHVLVEAKHKSIENKRWYLDIVNTFNVDAKGDMMIPVPGTTQGNFCPHFLTF